MGLGGWRDVAIVLLAIEGIAATLVFGFVLHYCIRGVLWLRQKTPTVTRPARYYMIRAATIVRQAGDAAVTPFVWLGSNAARARAVRDELKRRGEDVQTG